MDPVNPPQPITQPTVTPPINPPVTPPPVQDPNTPKKKGKLGLIISLLIILLLLCVSGAAGYTIYKNLNSNQGGETACTLEAMICPDGSSVGREGPNCEFTPCPSPTVTAFQNLKEFTDESLGISFGYPMEYESPQTQENYMSLISPLNPDRNPKNEGPEDGELKVEIVVEPAVPNDSPSKCWDDHSSGDGLILGQKVIDFAGTKTTLIDWQGFGTGQFICIQNKDKRYLINKYPLETSRQSEYENILSTFKFTE